MRSALSTIANRHATRSRSTSLSTVPPSATSSTYSPQLAALAARILYLNPAPSPVSGLPVYILSAAALPDAFEVDYDSLLSYVLARLPGEDELLSGHEYEIIFFAGGNVEREGTADKKDGPGMGWYLQAYHLLSRATRKRLRRLWIVHPRTWVRVLVGVFSTIVSPKSKRKIGHAATLSQLSKESPIESLLIPPAVYLHDRKLEPSIDASSTSLRAFGTLHPFPSALGSTRSRLPRILRETTSFLLEPSNLEIEGLFRIPPSAVLLNVLHEAYARGQNFLVFKEPRATFAPPGISPALLAEIRLEDAYGVHLAASLIKTWYRELRVPIIPDSAYSVLHTKFGDASAEVTPEALVDLLLPASPNSPLTPLSREILVRHLLPLLSAVSSHADSNKMSAENLAICFSMCLVRGRDGIEDARVASLLRRVLGKAVEMWPSLREGMGLSEDAFERDLKAPREAAEYEDPGEDEWASVTRLHEGEDAAEEEGHRILLSDVELDPPTDVRQESIAPALPPRPRAISGGATLPKRKPAPAPAPPLISTTHEPPRYSTVFDVDGKSLLVNDSPISYTAPEAGVANGFGPRRVEWTRAVQSADEKRGGAFEYSGGPVDTGTHPATRKAVSGDHNPTSVDRAQGTSTTRAASEGSSLPPQPSFPPRLRHRRLRLHETHSPSLRHTRASSRAAAARDADCAFAHAAEGSHAFAGTAEADRGVRGAG